MFAGGGGEFEGGRVYNNPAEASCKRGPGGPSSAKVRGWA